MDKNCVDKRFEPAVKWFIPFQHKAEEFIWFWRWVERDSGHELC